MAKITRIATTVTARYFPGQGAADAFYLDGRLNGKRESRAADITLDREERGFFFSTFAHQTGAGRDAQTEISALRPVLDKILNDVKRTSKNIDAEINELADCGVSVAGRMTLQHPGARQPYFAGIVVKDQEIAAITIGRGCAYLYRSDILYPLTDDDFEMEEIDAFGRPVDALDMYCAGVAGTVRYSNIAQLQMDDCLIVCNREVMEALGQREVLRILYEADDQCDAAGMVITEAAAKSPGASLQFMIGFVESATVADKPARGFGIGRGRSAPAQPSLSNLPVAPVDMSDVPALFDPSKRQSAAPLDYDAPLQHDVQDLEDNAFIPSDEYAMGESDEPMPLESDAIVPVLDIPDIANRSQELEHNRSRSYVPPKPHTPPARDRHHDEVYPDPGQPEDEDDGRPYGRSRIGIYFMIAIVTIATIVALYLIFREPPATGATTTASQSVPGATTLSPTTASGETSASTTLPGETTVPSETAATTGAPTVIIDPGTPKDLPADYVVKSGDTLYRIALYFYDSGDAYFLQLIRDANGISSDALFVDQKLVIPVVPTQP